MFLFVKMKTHVVSLAGDVALPAAAIACDEIDTSWKAGVMPIRRRVLE